ncbi:hypothetical protein [Ferrovibrio xuzhouensis]|uniref:Uncharacterized protein n=1 Tax=Ferrovibrio xuzhouensis TaxID=1576914 RepID=A0ABV7VCS7_9PROT
MSGLLLGIAMFAAGCGAHAALLRFLSSRFRLKALPLLLLLALCGLWFVASALGTDFSIEDIAVGTILGLSLGFAYALVMAAVVSDSPTMAIINRILNYGPAGMPVADIAPFIETHRFIGTRLDTLSALGEIEIADARIAVKGQAIRLLALGDLYRALRGDIIDHTG